eukprot:CAMPEP_0177155792 /NCGR_PEP_ID=MMETSP0367-20130122/2363_1 /TAXON_ID=447022 ORGANISM="Scrippsiella hangoei-like, Strain SHHI-4" /NCGR_SAMPLE_ID=MMETSP0367 /ASSEMBLY_ACC=CAM_ASM_000362 /LENGTH=39 /DNA_ID= /DNA_START= /DNA_END= /DNA_ORIENTATION=
MVNVHRATLIDITELPKCGAPHRSQRHTGQGFASQCPDG